MIIDKNDRIIDGSHIVEWRKETVSPRGESRSVEGSDDTRHRDWQDGVGG